MPPKQKKKQQVQKLLFTKIPETPVPEPYFSIPSPEPYIFPLSQTMMEGIHLLEHYEPEDINNNIRMKLPSQRVERMYKYRDTTCFLGKDGHGLLVNDTYMNVRGVTAFAYGPGYMIIAFEDLRVEVYTLQMRLIKVLKNFSTKKISFLKILSVPKSYESIIVLTCEGKRVMVHRIEKSMFSTLSVKLSKEVIINLQYPVTQMIEIPSIFKFYLRNDNNYKDCSLVCVNAVNVIYILKVNHFRLSMDDFVTLDHKKRLDEVGVSSVSWGEAKIEAPSRFISGNKLVLAITSGDQVYFLALREMERYFRDQLITECQWVESYPLKVDEGVVAFCIFIKKSQLFIVTEQNKILIIHTKQFDIFQKQINTSNIQKIVQQFANNLQGKAIGFIPLKKQPELQMQSRNINQLTEQQKQKLFQTPLSTYTHTFEYEFPDREIFFLSQRKFEVYHYCDWRVIIKMMSVKQDFEGAMLFLIAVYKKANKFDLGVEECEDELSDQIQFLVSEYIDKKLSKIKNIPDILNFIESENEYFKMIVTPIEFLTQTEQFTYLFGIAKNKIIHALRVDDSQSSLKQATDIFYNALCIFIEHGRIKYIPDEQLQETLKYFTDTDNVGMIDRLALFFDLKKIDQNIVIQCLLQNNLVVSLAHICTQGNESQFITPFVRLWATSDDLRRKKNPQYAAAFAVKALWYVQLCLQRNWALKQYSFQRYADMIKILSKNFLTEKILIGLLQIKTYYCLETIAFYFTIENSVIICNASKNQLNLGRNDLAEWIRHREGFEQLEMLLSTVETCLKRALPSQVQASNCFNLFLSTIIIYKTVKFTEFKYLDILLTLIENYGIIKEMNYGLEEKTLNNFKQNYEDETPENIDKILSARYINKILTLVYYENPEYIKQKFTLLLSKAAEYNLTDLQSEICFFLGNYKKCIEIYRKSQGVTIQKLVFEFLENSFKKLNLEKRREDKRKLAACITQNIEWIVELDPQSTIIIIQNYIKEIKDNLIEALSGKETLQLQFLEEIVTKDNLVDMKESLSEESIAKYVLLMAKYKKNHLIESFKKNPRFTTEQALKICQQYRVYDCMEYLYERMGNISGSVKIAALRIDEILSLKSRGQDDDEDANAPFIKMKQILDNVIEVCRKNHSQQIWQSLLDSFIELYRKYQHSNIPKDEMQFFFYMNGQVMENLALNCPIEHTIDLLRHKYKDLNMGGKMSHAFTNILANLSHTINIYYIATNLISYTLQKQIEYDYLSKLESYSTTPVCEACRFGIVKTAKSTHFKCGHAYHNDCMVGKDTVVCVSCLKKQTEQFDYYLNTLNPQHPKIKKISELFESFQDQKMRMSQIFKVQQFERSEKKEESVLVEINQKKKNRFELFDEAANEMEIGNRRVLTGLSL